MPTYHSPATSGPFLRPRPPTPPCAEAQDLPPAALLTHSPRRPYVQAQAHSTCPRRPALRSTVEEPAGQGQAEACTSRARREREAGARFRPHCQNQYQNSYSGRGKETSTNQKQA